MIKKIVVMPNRTDVKIAKPFRCRVASRRSDFAIEFLVEPEKVDCTGEI